jgi:hypothetical protein
MIPNRETLILTGPADPDPQHWLKVSGIAQRDGFKKAKKKIIQINNSWRVKKV